MESIYYVLCWACHRKCVHCYESRFRPYAPAELRGVVDEARLTFPRVIRQSAGGLQLPRSGVSPWKRGAEAYARRPGRIILAGGEVLLDPVREEVLYPALEALRDRYADQGVRVIVQTTGDLVTPEIVDDLLSRGVWMISCAGMDDFHVGMEGEKRDSVADAAPADVRGGGPA